MAQITVIVPTSPIPSHPTTRILDETLDSVQSHLPGAPIIVTCDGVRPGTVEPVREAYQEYVSTVIQKKGLTVRAFPTHVHQSGMMVAALSLVKTPLVLYLEHDWELGHPIEWHELMEIIQKGEANYIKFYQGSRIHPQHEHMMFQRVITHNIPLIQTNQYSANPHLASTAWYRTFVPLFSAFTDYIENLLHGPIANAPWSDYKCMIYNPVNGDMKRSFHLDGAGSR